MPVDGLCADLTCDKNIKHLYECHCCSSLICFQHLNEHIEATQRNKERFGSLRNELKTAVDTFKVIVEEKLLNIEREKSLIEKAQKLSDAQTGSIDEVQTIFEEIKEAIAFSQLEGIIKVEPALQSTKSCSCICKCGNQNDEFLLKTTPPPSDRTTVAIEDVHIVKEQNKDKTRLLKGVRGLCPLTFDGAFGLTAANHSIHFCSNKKTRLIGLYEHFINKHRLQPTYIRRLFRAISNNEDPKTTKLFDENEEVVNQLFKIPCPFSKDMIHLFRGSAKDIRRIPCHYLRMPDYALLHHLKYYHHVTEGVAQTLVDQSKEIQMEKFN
ncbi:unnamed protein product [Adineta steineri]|uniref:Uncharacterized protein n=1 Tax=Adineta steineri TaxID=433720 RepID=A0A814XGH7_9BILA|nr:unnamed protein product [Adineta steineri]